MPKRQRLMIVSAILIIVILAEATFETHNFIFRFFLLSGFVVVIALGIPWVRKGPPNAPL